jgi:succinate dehydrogenase / fumarate reductase cytochrome b subunit
LHANLSKGVEPREGDCLDQKNGFPTGTLTPMTHNSRPLSPDVQIYRPQLTSVLSISHRVTGIVLSIGTLLLVFCLIAAAAGPQAYSAVQGLIRSWVGLLLMFGWTFSLFFHLCNGIRHLFWDAGYGFELQTIYASGWTVVAASTMLTVATWLSALL